MNLCLAKAEHRVSDEGDSTPCLKQKTGTSFYGKRESWNLISLIPAIDNRQSETGIR